MSAAIVPPPEWITGRDGEDVAQVPAARLIAPAVVLDFTAEAAADPDFLLQVEHVTAWQEEHGPLPEGGWLLYRTGWDAYAHDQEEFLRMYGAEILPRLRARFAD